MALNTYQLGTGDALVLPMGLNPATVAAGSWNNQIITEFDRELYKRVYTSTSEVDRHPNRADYDLSDLIKFLGYQRPILPGVDGSYGHWERDWIQQSLIVGTGGLVSVGSPGPGSAFKFALDEESVFEGEDGRAYCYARVKETIPVMVGTELYTLWITDVTRVGNTFEVTVVPNDSSVNVFAALGGAGSNVGTEFAVGATAYQEGSNHGLGKQSRNLKYKNQVQIIREDNIETGSSRTRSYEVQKVVDNEGNLVSWELKGEVDAFIRAKEQREMAICLGTLNDNFVVSNPAELTPSMSDVPVHTTEGILTFAMKYGYNTTYNGASMNIDMFDAKNDILDAEAAPDDYIIAAGANYVRGLRDIIKGYVGDSSSNQYTMAANTVFASDNDTLSRTLALQVGFSTVQLQPSNRRFHIKTIKAFQNPKTLGANHYKFKDMGFYLPVGDVKNTMPKVNQSSYFGDVVDASRVPYFGYVYSARNSANNDVNYNREMHVWRTGGNAGTPTDGWDVDRLHILGEFGAVGAAGNLFLTDFTTGSGS